MCNVDKYRDYLSRLEDYLEFVNTDVEELMKYETELYTAYGSHHGYKVEYIKDWYDEAEDDLLTELSPEDFVSNEYGIPIDPSGYDTRVPDIVDELIEKGELFECGGYWFHSE